MRAKRAKIAKIDMKLRDILEFVEDSRESFFFVCC